MAFDITIAEQPIRMILESDGWQIIIAISGIITAIITAIALGFQIRKQSRINSAQLSLELIKRVRDEDFAEIVDNIFAGKSNECDPITLERFLNHFDMMAKFHEEKLLNLGHLIQIYGGLLERIKDDKYIQEKIQENKKLFQPLIRLYSKV